MTDIYYQVEDVMQILSYSRAKSYQIIKNLNNELENKGYLVRRGMIPISYFNKRYKIG